MASKPGQRRASGETAAAEEAAKGAETLDDPINPELPEERERALQFSGFSRMRLDWQGEEQKMVRRIRDAVNGAILNHFADAYAVMSDLYDVVREPMVDQATGVIQKDQWGFVVWARSHTGAFQEDWSRLTHAQREDFLYRITSALFEWEQRSADLWGEAMFAKAIWQERFAKEYDAPMTGTIDDRTARGNMNSVEEKYFAIFLTLLSKKADAVVRTMTLLGQRLRDTLG